MSRRITRKWIPAGSNSRENAVKSKRKSANAPIRRLFHKIGAADMPAVTRTARDQPIVRSRVIVKMIEVSSASQVGTLRANKRPAKAVAASRTELSLNACSKGMGEFLDLGGMEHPISRHRRSGYVRVGPRHDGYRIAVLGVVRQCEDRIFRVGFGSSGFTTLTEREQAQHDQQMVGAGTKAGVLPSHDQAKGV